MPPGRQLERDLTPMLALLSAGNRVRGGFMYWLKGAPTHVLAELLNQLEADGWELRRRDPEDVA